MSSSEDDNDNVEASDASGSLIFFLMDSFNLAHISYCLFKIQLLVCSSY